MVLVQLLCALGICMHVYCIFGGLDLYFLTSVMLSVLGACVINIEEKKASQQMIYATRGMNHLRVPPLVSSEYVELLLILCA